MIDWVKRNGPFVLLGLLGLEVLSVLTLGLVSVVTGEPIRVVIP
jgi:hypothetical protein